MGKKLQGIVAAVAGVIVIVAIFMWVQHQASKPQPTVSGGVSATVAAPFNTPSDTPTPTVTVTAPSATPTVTVTAPVTAQPTDTGTRPTVTSYSGMHWDTTNTCPSQVMYDSGTCVPEDAAYADPSCASGAAYAPGLCVPDFANMNTVSVPPGF